MGGKHISERPLLIIITIAAATLFSCGDDDPTNSASGDLDDPLAPLAVAVVEALKANDVEDYLNLYPTQDDAKASRLDQITNKQIKDVAAELSLLVENESTYRPQFVERFHEIAKAHDWSQARITKIKSKTRKDGTIEIADSLMIEMRIGDQRVDLKLDDLIKTPNGWRFGESTPMHPPRSRPD